MHMTQKVCDKHVACVVLVRVPPYKQYSQTTKKIGLIKDTKKSLELYPPVRNAFFDTTAFVHEAITQV